MKILFLIFSITLSLFARLHIVPEPYSPNDSVFNKIPASEVNGITLKKLISKQNLYGDTLFLITRETKLTVQFKTISHPTTMTYIFGFVTFQKGFFRITDRKGKLNRRFTYEYQLLNKITSLNWKMIDKVIMSKEGNTIIRRYKFIYTGKMGNYLPE